MHLRKRETGVSVQLEGRHLRHQRRDQIPQKRPKREEDEAKRNEERILKETIDEQLEDEKKREEGESTNLLRTDKSPGVENPGRKNNKHKYIKNTEYTSSISRYTYIYVCIHVYI